MNYFLQVGLRRLNLKLRSQFRLRLIKAWVTDTYSSATLAVATDNWSVSSFSDFWRSPGPGLGYPVTSSQLLLTLMSVSVYTRSENGKPRIGLHVNVEMSYLNTIVQLFLFVQQLDQLDVCLPYSRLITWIPILVVFQNLRWNSNKTSLYKQ